MSSVALHRKIDASPLSPLPSIGVANRTGHPPDRVDNTVVGYVDTALELQPSVIRRISPIGVFGRKAVSEGRVGIRESDGTVTKWRSRVGSVRERNRIKSLLCPRYNAICKSKTRGPLID